MGVSNQMIMLFTVFAAMVARTAAATAKPECRSNCGSLTIPYPFGVGIGCYLHQGFRVDCNETTSKAYIDNQSSNLEITDITLFPPRVRYLSVPSYECYSESGVKNIQQPGWVDLSTSPYTFSDTENTFVATGCDTIALIRGSRGRNYTGGCVSYCGTLAGIADGKCSGIGCCESSIPKGLKQYNLTLGSFANHTNIDGNPCSLAFVVDRGNYTFKLSDITSTNLTRTYRAVLDWSVGTQACEDARSGSVDGSSYACVSDNSECVNADNGGGYNCRCSPGYEGNPYLPGGCTDVDECKSTDIHCKGMCINTIGSYECVCPRGTTGNATGDGCASVPGDKKGIPLYLKLGIGSIASVLILIITVSWTLWGIQKRKYIKMKQQFFEDNGGEILKQLLSTGKSKNFKIYSIQVIKKATEDFDSKSIVGKGGNGVVYKGIINDTEIAIKRCIRVDDKKSKEFANEMLILSQINHANVVKLLGCCLEVEVPMLVYEFVPQGTLFHLVHNRRPGISFPWDLRLKIATESAKALSYLHHDVSTTILHGDVKSSNILLDEHFKAKVSDFGTSTLAPKDKYQFMTLVQGTYGYLDPECLQTCQLTLKSDVYSFGVVLAELLTGKMALYKDGTEQEKSLAMNFTSSVKSGRLADILDTDVNDEEMLPQIEVVADIAVQCLSLRGDERPSMTDVYLELQALTRSHAQPWLTQNSEESEGLINWNMDTSALEANGNTNNMGNVMLELQAWRRSDGCQQNLETETKNINLGNYAANIGGR